MLESIMVSSDSVTRQSEGMRYLIRRRTVNIVNRECDASGILVYWLIRQRLERRLVGSEVEV